MRNFGVMIGMAVLTAIASSSIWAPNTWAQGPDESMEDRGAANHYPRPTMLGEEIRNARVKAGLTQEELSFQAKISRQYVSLLELNQKSPTIDVFMRVCKAMGVSAAEIIGRIEGNVN